jgi:hypothetical protein
MKFLVPKIKEVGGLLTLTDIKESVSSNCLDAVLLAVESRLTESKAKL